MILNSRQAAEYREMPWLYPAADDEVLVIHTLCVPPSMAGCGWARAWWTLRPASPSGAA